MSNLCDLAFAALMSHGSPQASFRGLVTPANLSTVHQVQTAPFRVNNRDYARAYECLREKVLHPSRSITTLPGFLGTQRFVLAIEASRITGTPLRVSQDNAVGQENAFGAALVLSLHGEMQHINPRFDRGVSLYGISSVFENTVSSIRERASVPFLLPISAILVTLLTIIVSLRVLGLSSKLIGHVKGLQEALAAARSLTDTSTTGTAAGTPSITAEPIETRVDEIIQAALAKLSLPQGAAVSGLSAEDLKSLIDSQLATALEPLKAALAAAGESITAEKLQEIFTNVLADASRQSSTSLAGYSAPEFKAMLTEISNQLSAKMDALATRQPSTVIAADLPQALEELKTLLENRFPPPVPPSPGESQLRASLDDVTRQLEEIQRTTLVVKDNQIASYKAQLEKALGASGVVIRELTNTRQDKKLAEKAQADLRAELDRKMASEAENIAKIQESRTQIEGMLTKILSHKTIVRDLELRVDETEARYKMLLELTVEAVEHVQKFLRAAPEDQVVDLDEFLAALALLSKTLSGDPAVRKREAIFGRASAAEQQPPIATA